MSVFHALSAGNTGHDPSAPFWSPVALPPTAAVVLVVAVGAGARSGPGSGAGSSPHAATTATSSTRAPSANRFPAMPPVSAATTRKLECASYDLANVRRRRDARLHSQPLRRHARRRPAQLAHVRLAPRRRGRGRRLGHDGAL